MQYYGANISSYMSRHSFFFIFFDVLLCGWFNNVYILQCKNMLIARYFALMACYANKIFCKFAVRNHNLVLWCNGSTPDSGSVSEGSNPSRTTRNSRNALLINVLRLSLCSVSHSCHSCSGVTYS